MFLQTLLLEGAFPERALIRLKREKIPVFNAKKVKKNQILFSIKRKHTEKVFAIYQNLWYNRDDDRAYTLKKVGGNVSFGVFELVKRRVGLVIGAVLFGGICLFAQNYILRVEIVGSSVYRREILQLLDQGGLGTYQRYDQANNQAVCAEIFKLDGVSFCSIQKQGVTLLVDVRTNPFVEPLLVQGDMLSNHDGKVLSICALRGTPQVGVGDEIKRGQTLVGGYFCKQSGEQVCVEVIATAKLLCCYQTQVLAETQEEAFAQAYLQLPDLQGIEIKEQTIVPCENGFSITLEYTVFQAMNL